MDVQIYDPWVCRDELKSEYGVTSLEQIDPDQKYEAIILAVAHSDFTNFDFEKYFNQGTIIFDTKAFINRKWVAGRL